MTKHPATCNDADLNSKEKNLVQFLLIDSVSGLMANGYGSGFIF